MSSALAANQGMARVGNTGSA